MASRPPYHARVLNHSEQPPPPQPQTQFQHPYKRNKENQSTARRSLSLRGNKHAVLPKTALTLLQEHRARKARRLSLLQRHSQQPQEQGGDWLSLGDGIHELAGEAGTGKTQVALSLLLQAAVMNTDTAAVPTVTAPDNNNNNNHKKTGCRAIYISLGKASMPKILQRLSQMAEAWALEHQQHQQQDDHQQQHQQTTAVHTQVLSRIMTRAVVNQDDLFHLMRHEMRALLEQETDTRVLVLDSVADLFRGMNHEGGANTSGACNNNMQDDKNLAASRSATLFSLAAILKEYSDTYHIPIVVINQVTARISNNNHSEQQQQQQSLSSVLPALGLSWAHCVNTSYLLTRQEQQHATTGTVFVRRLWLRRSSEAACTSRQSACLRVEAAGARIVD